jgi:hypothetical protein
MPDKGFTADTGGRGADSDARPGGTSDAGTVSVLLRREKKA